LFEGTAYQPADRLDPVKTPKANLWHAAHRVVVEAATVLNSLEAALADNRIDHREAAALQADIEEAERALATIREAVKSLGRG
jgi:hypothetical protein